MSQAAEQYAGVTSAPIHGAQLGVVRESSGDAGPSGRLPAFVGGPENRLLIAVMNQIIARLAGGEAVDQSPPLPHPLVLVGRHGSGKTHLARGLVELWQAARGTDNAAYFTAADFAREYAAAIDRQEVREFRRQVRRKQLIVIDDVHRLGESAHRHNELRHTLDAIGRRGGLMLLTSLSPIAEASAFDRPLLSRLAEGLTIEIAPPGQDARRELLLQAAAAVGCKLEHEALESLAEQLPPEPPRVLRAAVELRRRAGTRIDVRAANRLIDDDKPKNSPPLGEILRVVARYYKITLKVLTSSSRRQSVVAARALAIYLARELTPLSYAQIGQTLGGRDHTTIMHNYRRVARLMPKDRALRSAAEELKRLLAPS